MQSVWPRVKSIHLHRHLQRARVGGMRLYLGFEGKINDAIFFLFALYTFTAISTTFFKQHNLSLADNGELEVVKNHICQGQRQAQ